MRFAPTPREKGSLVRWAGTLMVGVAALGSAACFGGDDDNDVALETEAFDLQDINDSGYTGEVTLVSAGGNRTVVTVALGQEGNLAGDFPAAIQEGTCDGLAGNVAYELDQLSSGFLTQEVSASMEDLQEQDHSVVVFQSNDRSVYVACADL
jgi:hypothetical protein